MHDWDCEMDWTTSCMDSRMEASLEDELDYDDEDGDKSAHMSQHHGL